jgi:hypothetical protein
LFIRRRHLESPHFRYQWLKLYIRVYTSIYEHIQCPMISYHIPVYWSDMNRYESYRTISVVYTTDMVFVESINVYIHVWGISRYMTVYDCLWRYMTVYDVPGKYIQVYTIMNGVYGCLWTVYQGIFLYIHVCNLTNQFVSCCTRPAGPPESCKSAAATSPLKTHSSSSTIVFTFCIFRLFRPAPPASLAGIGLAVAVVGGSAARPALHAQDHSPCSHPCSNATIFT